MDMDWNALASGLVAILAFVVGYGLSQWRPRRGRGRVGPPGPPGPPGPQGLMGAPLADGEFERLHLEHHDRMNLFGS